jgi:transposase
MGRRLVVAWQEQDSAAALKARYQREAVGEVRTRLQALWRLRQGASVKETAQAVGAHYRTVQRWLGDYRRGGVAAVTARRSGGHGLPARLSAEQAAALRAEAARGTFRTATEVRDWIAAQFGVQYGAGGIYSVLARLGLHPKVPRPVNPKADPAAQAAWKKGA